MTAMSNAHSASAASRSGLGADRMSLYAPTPSRVLSTGHAAPNTGSGGLYAGFSRLSYQSRISGWVGSGL